MELFWGKITFFYTMGDDFSNYSKHVLVNIFYPKFGLIDFAPALDLHDVDSNVILRILTKIVNLFLVSWDLKTGIFVESSTYSLSLSIILYERK